MTSHGCAALCCTAVLSCRPCWVSCHMPSTSPIGAFTCTTTQSAVQSCGGCACCCSAAFVPLLSYDLKPAVQFLPLLGVLPHAFTTACSAVAVASVLPAATALQHFCPC
jgi:hypothetical protein